MILVDFLGWMMQICYKIIPNYGMAIILFILVSKIILLPISIWVQKNSIKMVKMQPEINRIRVKYFGDKDTILEEQAKIYKKYRYNPLITLVPLIAQIVLLLGVVEIVKNPELYIGVANLDYNFLGFDLGLVASETGGMAILIPIMAGLSAMTMCVRQNKMNVLQAEQTKINKYGMMLFSVGLSLYLGTFVTAGVALYWTASNLLAVVQQWILNIAIDPKKYVDYKALDKTRAELKKLQTMSRVHKRTSEEIKKERTDYKKFFSIVNKKLVFYSEGSGFYKYYQGIIEYILEKTNLVIHYITSDYNDQIFEIAKKEPRIKPYYIGEKKLATLMMKMEADVVVMTMPDIDNFYIKRSYIDKHTTYIYIPHGLDSLNMTMRKRSMNNYDVVFVTGKYQREELEAIQEKYDTKIKEIVSWGYTLLDDMMRDYQKNHRENNNKKDNKRKTVMIAPSWQKDNIIELCLDKILKATKGKDYNIIVRPHPQQMRKMKDVLEEMKEKYAGTNITIQTDFTETESVLLADVLITDWSSVGYEYAFTTGKPVISIDTPMKVMNPDYKEIGVEPTNIWSRGKIGEIVKVKDINEIDKVIKKVLKNRKKYQKQIIKLREESVYNLGNSAKIGGKYIIECVQAKIKERRELE